MPYIGSAYLNVTPKFPNLAAEVRKALGEVDTGPAGREWGEKTGSGMAGGLMGSGAIIGAVSQVVGRAMDSISAHVGDAIDRFDTLNQYPKTMQLLGYSAEDAESSISKMSDRLSALPTRLDDMVGTVQGIVAVTGDLDQATDAGLALNDMLVASGSSTQLTTAAMEQFRQMLAKGKPEMEDWRSLTSAMPGQMQQLAQAMLGPTANANDLYEALGGGKNEAVLSMDDLLDAMVRLDNEGGQGITSFREQAETAAGGVKTAVANMENAITKGLAGTLEAIGQDTISSALGDVRDGITDTFERLNGAASAAVPALKSLWEAAKEVGPALAAMGAGSAVFEKVGSGALTLAERVKAAGEASGVTAKANALLGTSFTPVSLGLTAAGAAAGLLVSAYLAVREEQEAMEKATTGLAAAVSDTMALDGYGASLSGIGGSASSSAMSVEELTEAMGRHVDAMAETNERAQEQIGDLSSAQAVINRYAGETDLSAQAQGQLEWALQLVNEQFGLSATAADVASDSYTDAEGNASRLTDTVNELIEAKKNEIRTQAVSDNLSEAYSARAEAADALAAAQKRYNEGLESSVRAQMQHSDVTREEAEAIYRSNDATNANAQALSKAQEEYDAASDSVSQLEGELGDAATAASESADALDQWGEQAGELFNSQLKGYGTSLAALKEDLRGLGANADELNQVLNPSTEEGRANLELLASSYDGTEASIVEVLEGMGISLDEGAKKAALATADMAEQIGLFGDSAASALDGAGVNVNDLAGKLAAAGVSTSELAAVGSENFAALASACGGNMDMMVWFIQHYNDTPLVDKDGDVQVDQAELIDAQGNLWTWNGSTLVDKNGEAALKDQEVLDAQGHLWTWNGSNLQYKDGTGRVHDLMKGGIASRDNWNKSGLKSYQATGTISIFENITRTINSAFGHAAGGIRLNAAGGVRAHAAGAIATSAVPLDIVGEDGAEAIVPLTNRRYSQPFADLIAEGVARRAATTAPAGRAEIAAAIVDALGRVGALRLDVDARSLAMSLAPEIDREAGRLAYMGV